MLNRKVLLVNFSTRIGAIFEDFLQNQKPCFGLSVNIPKDSMQKIAMLNYFKDKVDFNPFDFREGSRCRVSANS